MNPLIPKRKSRSGLPNYKPSAPPPPPRRKVGKLIWESEEQRLWWDDKYRAKKVAEKERLANRFIQPKEFNPFRWVIPVLVTSILIILALDKYFT